MIDESFALLSDLGEIAIDSIIKDPILKEIPILGSVFNVIKLSLNIQDRIFINKLKTFIDNVEKMKSGKKNQSNYFI